MSTDIRPCVGALYHAPIPAERDRHHVIPMHLSTLLGQPVNPRTVLLCSGCHDLVHHVLRHWINTGTPDGHRIPAGARAVVAEAWEWWQASLS